MFDCIGPVWYDILVHNENIPDSFYPKTYDRERVMESYEIAVIGGGASGLAAAIAAARAGASVCVIERLELPGRKILATGNGRCNYTNRYIAAECYHSQNLDGVARVLQEFDSKTALEFFMTLGIVPRFRDDCAYPRSLQAASVCQALLSELAALRVAVRTRTRITHIRSIHSGFQLLAETYPLKPDMGKKKKKKIRADYSAKPELSRIQTQKVILACGGKASPNLGSDGSGYDLASSFGHKILPVVPALNGLCCKEAFFGQISGVRVEGRVTLMVDGQEQASEYGEIQMTDTGISGIPVFQLCSMASYALMEGRRTECVLDFFEEWTDKTLEDFFIQRFQQMTGRDEQAFFNGLLPEKLMDLCVSLSGFHPVKNSLKHLSGSVKNFVRLLKHFPVTITDSRGFEQAQACAGGVPLDEVELPYCASRRVPGLYITGEILDADGRCGGYNLHWAWATGIQAGTHAAQNIR